MAGLFVGDVITFAASFYFNDGVGESRRSVLFAVTFMLFGTAQYGPHSAGPEVMKSGTWLQG